MRMAQGHCRSKTQYASIAPFNECFLPLLQPYRVNLNYKATLQLIVSSFLLVALA